MQAVVMSEEAAQAVAVAVAVMVVLAISVLWLVGFYNFLLVSVGLMQELVNCGILYKEWKMGTETSLVVRK